MRYSSALGQRLFLSLFETLYTVTIARPSFKLAPYEARPYWLGILRFRISNSIGNQTLKSSEETLSKTFKINMYRRRIFGILWVVVKENSCLDL